MPKQRRWMKWILEEADATPVVMPWERSSRRAGWSTEKAAPMPERALEEA